MELKIVQLVLAEIIPPHALVLQFHQIVDFLVLGGGLIHGGQLLGEELLPLLMRVLELVV